MSANGIGLADDDQFMTLASLERIIEVCDRFEAAWRDGLKPLIEDCVNGEAEPFRTSVFARAARWWSLELPNSVSKKA